MARSMHVPGRWIRRAAAVALLGCAVPVVAQQSVKFKATERAFSEAYRQEDWNLAVDLGYKLVQILPESAVPKYNLACVYALKGDSTSSLVWLRRAAEAGFKNLSHMEADSDLDAVRDLAGYASVRSAVADNKRHHRGKVCEKAAAKPPIVVAPENLRPGERVPVIIALHGFGDRPERYPQIWGGAAAEIGAVLAVPQGLRPVGNGFAWGDLEEAEAILDLTMKQVDKWFPVDRDRIVLTGFSQGAFLAMALGTRHQDLFAGVIPIGGGYLPEIDAPPEATRGSPRFYFLVGSLDQAAAQTRRAADDYEKAGYDVKLRVAANVGHTFPRPVKRELGRALEFVLDR
jgi:phospholipase/carboxylesterase